MEVKQWIVKQREHACKMIDQPYEPEIQNAVPYHHFLQDSFNITNYIPQKLKNINY